LALERVGISAGRRPVVRDLSLAVADGEALTLMGASGSGKSSVLAYCCGALPAGVRGSGRVLVDGRDVTALPPHRRRIGLLFQDDLLFPHLSVGGNLLFGLHPDIRGTRARRLAAEAALDEAELGGLFDRDVRTLSGGQRARIGLLRVLLSRPAALLLDEPFSGLDAGLRARFRELVFSRARAAGLPLLLVTHDPADATGRVLRLPDPDFVSAPPSGR
jgi:putative thiamine transport system ATP-binding protein